MLSHDAETLLEPLLPDQDGVLVRYEIALPLAEAARRAADIAVEQTVEFPPELIAQRALRDAMVGQVLQVRELAAGRSVAVLRYALAVVGSELTQLLNVLFGNISLTPGVRLVDLALPPDWLARVAGPRFGRAGLRARTGVGERAIVATALKPIGLTVRELARRAQDLALGGIDLIKDDHGLADQPVCPFEERVERVAAAVAEANALTGRRCLYCPNVTGPADLLPLRARRARALGAGGILIAPGLAGFDALRQVATDPQVDLPILCHPALLGSFTTRPSDGIAHGVLYGTLVRLFGADATIFPHFGGRFAFTPLECAEIVRAARTPLGMLAPILPVPAGGMALARVPELLRFYGPDVVLLIGGDLHRHGPDLVQNARRFVAAVERGAVAAGPE